MFIATAPIILDLDKKIVNAAIMQLELETETNDAKNLNQFLNKNSNYLHKHNFIVNHFVVVQVLEYNSLSRKHIKIFFPMVPTPPPNKA